VFISIALCVGLPAGPLDVAIIDNKNRHLPQLLKCVSDLLEGSEWLTFRYLFYVYGPAIQNSVALFG